MKALKALTFAGLAAVIIGGMTLASCNGGGSKSGSDSTASIIRCFPKCFLSTTNRQG
jgi:hypothetical protein